MESVRPTVLAAVIAALSLAGCGAGSATVEPASAPAGPAAGTTVAVETTDGRLGGATTVQNGARPRELSPGGPLDARRHPNGPRRDGVGAGASCANVDMAPSPANRSAMVGATLCLVNGERADRGLAALVPNAKLATAASAYAQDLVDGSYFSHTGRDGSSSFDRIKRSGYLTAGFGYRLGENLAWGTGALATPRSIMQAWMNSAGHRQNLLNPAYRDFGVGIALGNPSARNGQGGTYANNFGVLEAPRAAKPAAPAARTAKQRKRDRKARRAQARRAQVRAARAAARSSR